MERIRELGNYQKFILILLVLMVLGFGVRYGITTSRVGYEYRDAILVPTEENGATVYSGEINGTPAAFTVTSGKAVTYQYGDKTYGPKKEEFNLAGQLLHAGEIGFVHPKSKENVIFSAPMPEDFKITLEKIREKYRRQDDV